MCEMIFMLGGGPLREKFVEDLDEIVRTGVPDRLIE